MYKQSSAIDKIWSIKIEAPCFYCYIHLQQNNSLNHLDKILTVALTGPFSNIGGK